MKSNIALGAVLAVTVGVASAPAWSATPTDEHSAHHSATTVEVGQFDKQMQTMQETHQKMQAAKTPDERAALMNDNMKAMQDGMAMMGQMNGGMSMGGKGMRGMQKDGSMSMKNGKRASEHESMRQRMDMMQMMMQMMMDRQSAVDPATK